MKKIFQCIVLLLATIAHNSFSCPFIITNNTDTETLIVDPFNNQALKLDPTNTGEIDPSIHGWHYYFYSEKLDIYVPRKDAHHAFYRKYQLIEKYCTADKTSLTLKDIIHFADKPTDRFTVLVFNEPELKPHLH